MMESYSSPTTSTTQSVWSKSRTPGPYGKIFWVNENTGATHYGTDRPEEPAHGLDDHHQHHQHHQHPEQTPPPSTQKPATQPQDIVSPICLQCSRVVRNNAPHVILNHRRIHAECFLCTGCDTSLARKDYMPHQNSQFCVPCYERLHAPRCSGCKQVCRVGEKLVVHSNCTWHAKCLDLHQVTDMLNIPGREVLLLCSSSSNQSNGDNRVVNQPSSSCQLFRHTGFDEAFQPSSSIDGIMGTTMAMYNEHTMYMVAKGSLYCLTLDPITHHVTAALEINVLQLCNDNNDNNDNNEIRGLKGMCPYGKGMLCIAPRGSLRASDRDCIVWVDKDTAEVHVLLQTELSDAVDMAIRPTGNAELDLFIWSHSLGVMRLRVLIHAVLEEDNVHNRMIRSFQCTDVSPITWIRPMDAESRPPPGVVSLVFLDERRLLILAPRDPKAGLLLMLTLSVALDMYQTKLLCATPLYGEAMAVRNRGTRQESDAFARGVVAKGSAPGSMLSASVGSPFGATEGMDARSVHVPLATATTQRHMFNDRAVYPDGNENGKDENVLLNDIASTFFQDDPGAPQYYAETSLPPPPLPVPLSQQHKKQSMVPAAAAVAGTVDIVTNNDDDDDDSNGSIATSATNTNTTATTNTTANTTTTATTTNNTTTNTNTSHQISPKSLRQKLREKLRRNSRRNNSSATGSNHPHYSPNQVAKHVQQTKDRLQLLRAHQAQQAHQKDVHITLGLSIPPPPPPTPPGGVIGLLPPGTVLSMPPPPPPQTPPGGTGQTPVWADTNEALFDMESSQKSPLLVSIAERQDALAATMRRRGLLKLQAQSLAR
jgi:hypothetical protein